MIKFIPHNTIDFNSWDRAILSSFNGLVYGQSYFLNLACPGWGAFVLNDFEALMPITPRRWSQVNLSQPFFAQQLGVFSTKELSPEMSNSFLKILANEFNATEIHLNESVPVKSTHSYFVEHKPNFVLHLNGSYEQIASSYNRDAKKNLKKAQRVNLCYGESTTIELVLQMYKEAYAHLNKKWKEKQYTTLINILKAADERNQLVLRLVVLDDQILASAAFLHYKDRLTYFLAAPNERGRRHSAMHFLIDEVIREFAGTPSILDFEGSSIPNVARFYKKFGSINRPYPVLSTRKQPWHIRLKQCIDKISNRKRPY